MANKKPEKEAGAPVYGKKQILKSKRYAHRIDLLGVLLEDGREYTFDEVDTLLNEFMKGGK